MKIRVAVWLMIGMLPLLAGCASTGSTVASCPNAKPCFRVVTCDSDIVRLPDGRIVGLMPPEGTP